MNILFNLVNADCPNCGAPEMHSDGDKVHVRGCKVCDDNNTWWSHCLVCAGYYTGINGEYDQERGNPNLGWFPHN